MYKVILSKEALADEAAGYDYYESQHAGLGEAFLDALENCYLQLSEHPQLYSFIDNRMILRDVKVKRFPYLVTYEIDGSNVFVYKVNNTYQRPFELT
jgi:toxin ParE1/3/4